MLLPLSLSKFVYPLLSLAAIFGADSRTPTPHGSTAVGVLRSLIEVKDGRTTIEGSPLSKFMCEEEKFSHDPSLSYACSGFLVAPDLLVTAGHCQVNTGVNEHDTDGWCSVYSWWFGYESGVNLKDVQPSSLYNCKEVIFAVKDEQPPFRDYALIRLERPVQGHTPYRLRETPVRVGEPLSMVGYPYGIPAKLTDDANVMFSDASKQSFITNLDAFEGNSGSAVFDAAGEVVGILVGGLPSTNTWRDGAKQCERWNKCSESGDSCEVPDKDNSVFPGFQRVGSEVQRIAPVLELIQRVQRGR